MRSFASMGVALESMLDSPGLALLCCNSLRARMRVHEWPAPDFFLYRDHVVPHKPRGGAGARIGATPGCGTAGSGARMAGAVPGHRPVDRHLRRRQELLLQLRRDAARR